MWGKDNFWSRRRRQQSNFGMYRFSKRIKFQIASQVQRNSECYKKNKFMIFQLNAYENKKIPCTGCNVESDDCMMYIYICMNVYRLLVVCGNWICWNAEEKKRTENLPILFFVIERYFFLLFFFDWMRVNRDVQVFHAYRLFFLFLFCSQFTDLPFHVWFAALLVSEPRTHSTLFSISHVTLCVCLHDDYFCFHAGSGNRTISLFNRIGFNLRSPVIGSNVVTHTQCIFIRFFLCCKRCNFIKYCLYFFYFIHCFRFHDKIEHMPWKMQKFVQNPFYDTFCIDTEIEHLFTVAEILYANFTHVWNAL